MCRAKNYTGKKFNRLTAIKSIGGTLWEFKCDCGKTKITKIYPVKMGRVKSCGCLHMERCRAGTNRLKHGDARKGKVTKLHKIWRKMIGRCCCKTDAAYSAYGGRGIKLCKEWLNDYVNFREWANNNGYAEGLTIERIDNDKGYCPNNCRFATRKEQARNRRTSNKVTYRGQTKCLSEWAEELNISEYTLWQRLNKLGWSVERALTEKTHKWTRLKS